VAASLVAAWSSPAHADDPGAEKPGAAPPVATSPETPTRADDPSLGGYSLEAARPRPLPLTEPLPDSASHRPPPERRVDVGAYALVVTRMTDEDVDGVGKGVTYDPGPGIGVAARIQVLRWFQVEAVFGWATHDVVYDHGAIGVDGDIESDFVTSSWLDARLLPTLPLGDRVRLFGIAGIGWGRVELPPVRATDASGTYWVRDRAASFFEIPLGLGGSVELVPRWLSVDLELVAAPNFSEDGSAYVPVQALDGLGHKHEIGPLPRFPVTFVQALGLSLLL
jgi:hypothetical protein